MPKKEAPLLEHRLDRHDRTQLELKLGYGLRPQRQRQAYRIDTFVFVPKVLALTRHSYGPARFYADTATFIRMTTPKVPLSDLSEKQAVNPWASDLREVIDRFADGGTGDVVAAETGLKLLACVLKSALRDARVALRKPLDRALSSSDGPRAAELMARFSDDVRTALARLRTLEDLVAQEGVPPKLRDAWRAVDEYCSLLAEEALTDVVALVESRIESQEVEATLDNLRDLAIAEFHHRRSRGFGTYASEDSRNEHLPYRWRVLKRFVSSVLYLKVSRESTGVLIGDIIGMVASGLAMLFATFALLLIQYRWATSLSIAFVSSMVAAYVIKDRIKELAKRFLGRGLNRLLADHAIMISGQGGERLGTLKEWFAIRKVTDLPGDVQDLRFCELKSHEEIEGRPESVMHYSKEIRLSSAGLEKQFAGATGLTDVTRISMAPLIARMDDPWEAYHFIHPIKRTLCEERCARVYHVNVVLRLEAEDGSSNLSRVRVVLSKQGIERVEDATADPNLTVHSTAVDLAPIRLDED